MKVFISTSSFGQGDNSALLMLKEAGLDVHLNPHGRKLSEDEMVDFLSGIDFLIAGTEPITKKVITSAKNLKIISRCGVGLDNVDLKAAAEAGIEVYNTPYGPTVSVAELTVGLILGLLRSVSLMDRQIRSGKWNKLTGNLLCGKKVGIVGFGRIGQKVARILKGFGAEIAYFDIEAKKDSLGFALKPLDELLGWSDIVSLHCSVDQKRMPLLGYEELKMMKKGSWLINVSRGGAVDEEALYLALKDGHLRGAALDVFSEEPYKGPLKELDNVVLTPHIGSYALESRVGMEIEAVENLLKGLK
ncbi:MAG: hydroxyacid dehydrogenase [Omnitrophica WOR_2 bacterium RIFCSPLOWO2_02_FULL_50_19]|nr:MAG: hydroxyacid dehydrogenase [Omnitrophica WOR_2 bacterium RIFCSPLOWO2_02_FULL_50_19]